MNLYFTLWKSDAKHIGSHSPNVSQNEFPQTCFFFFPIAFPMSGHSKDTREQPRVVKARHEKVVSLSNPRRRPSRQPTATSSSKRSLRE